MSTVSFELKRKAIQEDERRALLRLKIIIPVVCILSFLILAGGYSLKFKIILACLIAMCGILAHSRFEEKKKLYFSNLLDKAFDNEILLHIAKETGLTFKPFGAFFLSDLGTLPIKKDANECVCKRSLVGTLGEISAKFGDCKLNKAHKRKKSLLGLDRFTWARVNDGKIYSGFIAKFEYPRAFFCELSAIAKGEFMLGAPNLKLQKASVSNSELFDIYADENFDSKILCGGVILGTLEHISQNLSSKIGLHIRENVLFIAIENDTLFTRQDDEQTTNLSASIKFMVQIAKNLENFATEPIKPKQDDEKLTALLSSLK